MSTHTPGPWIWVKDELFQEAEWLAYDAWLKSPDTEEKWVGRWRQRPTAIVETDGGYYGPHGADRPLIATAPDLVAALRAMIDMCRGHFDHDRQPQIQEARAAIKKAEGLA
jgi:hypothetical protein